MTSAERRRTIKAMPISPDRYFAAYCHEVMGNIELHGFYTLDSRYQGERFRDGIKKFFKMKVKITDKLTLTL
jgi:hypothetical protein